MYSIAREKEDEYSNVDLMKGYYEKEVYHADQW